VVGEKEKKKIMSAPKQGRQSPSPSRQPGAQQQETVASGKTESYEEGGEEKGGEEEERRSGVEGLESNPRGPLEDSAAEKVRRG